MLPAHNNLSTDTEIQVPPYIDPPKVNAANKDVLDPQDRVRSWNPTPDPQGYIAAMKKDLGFRFVYTVYSEPPPPPPQIIPNRVIDSENRLITVYSLGRTVTVTDSSGNTYFTPEDDILGFRLRKQGEKGNKQ